ncbi:MAG TPA: ribose 5-phosphate isomerase A [Verrucomicrobiae bacterium]|nr:ribose 5-phosphate isomerase A [Verrucomicrobiae bacterium]
MSNPSNNSSVYYLEKSFEKIAKDILNNHFNTDKLLIGLGSGRAVSKVINSMTDFVIKKCDFICTSMQIKIDAEKKGLAIIDESNIPYIDLVIDGADQIDKNYFMIKGGGGALLREKILFNSARKTIIVGDFSKFVNTFSRSLPIEVLPFGRTAVAPFLKELGGNPILRTLEKGYPYITENGNIILDTIFDNYDKILEIEQQIRKIPGVIETGLFNKPASIYYKALENGDFQKIDTEHHLL